MIGVRGACLSLALGCAASADAAQASLTPFQRDKAGALLRTQLACLGCHELNGEGGRIGPSLTDVGTRRSPRYIRAMIEEPQRAMPGSAMPNTMVAPAVRELITRYLAADARGADVPRPAPPAPSAPPARAAHADPPRGAALYTQWCAACHGATGNGDGPNAGYLPVKPARHADSAAMGRRADDALYDMIAVGGAPYGRSPRMPAFGATLSPAEIRALVAHIRTLCRCRGPAWSRDGAAR